MAVVHPSRSAARRVCEIPLTDLDGDCQVANRQLRKRKITLVRGSMVRDRTNAAYNALQEETRSEVAPKAFFS